MKHEFTIDGMKCNGCANTVETKVSEIPSVTAVKVDLENNKIILDSDTSISRQEITDALADTNYSVA